VNSQCIGRIRRLLSRKGPTFVVFVSLDAGKTTYGVLARHANVSLTGSDPVAVESVVCGRLIRKAWFAKAA
jgi:hypothetical protein